MELEGKVALVTGGNGGIGSRICHALARAGCDVAVVYARSRQPAEIVATEVRQLGVKSEALGCDVSDPTAVQALVDDAMRRFGRIDIRCMAVAPAPQVLVNCVAPGYIEGTRATSNLDPAYQERSRESSLLKRAADTDDIAAQVVELCRPDSITGQTLAIDAGRVFH